MASVSGSYRETTIPTIAAMIVLIDAHFTALNARMIALGGAATSIIGNITLTIRAENGAAESYSHKLNISFNCPLLADLATLTAALSVFATAVETESAYTTIIEVSANVNTSMSN